MGMVFMKFGDISISVSFNRNDEPVFLFYYSRYPIRNKVRHIRFYGSFTFDGL